MTNVQSPYRPIRSAFTIIEKPLRYCYDQYNPTNDGSTSNVKNYLAYLGGMAVYPIVVCAAPVTMVADIAIGIAECTFVALSGDSLADIATLAKKKLVISPIQHLTFIITSLALPALCLATLFYNAQAPLSWLYTAKVVLLPISGLFLGILSTPLVVNENHAKEAQTMPAFLKPLTQNRLLFMAVQTFFVASASWNFVSLGIYTLPALSVVSVCALPLALTSLLWTHNYTLSQRMIGSLPSSWNHETFSIFIDRGALVKEVGTRFPYAGPLKPGQTFSSLGFSDSNAAFWEAFADECRAKYKKEKKLQKQVDWNTFLKYVEFNKIGKDEHINPLYTDFRDGILSRKSPTELLGFKEKPTRDEIRKAYHKYSRALHPDKNRDREEESKVLFQCLNEATSQLEKTLEAKAKPKRESSKSSSASTDIVPADE